jgi:hypothetical protein
MCCVGLEVIKVLAPVLKFLFRPNSNHRSLVHFHSKAVCLSVKELADTLWTYLSCVGCAGFERLPDAESVDVRVPLPMHLFHLPRIG